MRTGQSIKELVSARGVGGNWLSSWCCHLAGSSLDDNQRCLARSSSSRTVPNVASDREGHHTDSVIVRPPTVTETVPCGAPTIARYGSGGVVYPLVSQMLPVSSVVVMD